MKYIGITGGIGAGKTEILQYIGTHYRCEIYLADQVAHEVKRAGTPCFDSLIRLFGSEILDTDGEIHKGRMADRMFAEPALVEAVNGIVHPAVREYLTERLEKARQRGDAELFFVEAALLIEAGYREVVDEMWYIYATEEIRRERLKAHRGYSEEKIEHIIGNQLSEAEYRSGCDFVIDNSGALTDSYRQIDERLKGYTRS